MIAMGDNNMEPETKLSSTYPLAPMDYVNLYTNENIKTGKAPLPPPIIKDTYECFGKEIDPNDVLIRSLDQQGIQRLYKTAGPVPKDTTAAQQPFININNHKKELKKLNHSILIAYLDLLEILVKAPNTQLPLDQQQIDLNSQQQTFKTLRDQKLEDIENLFINMHHLINELRPHQARDNIRCILEMQKRQRLETANKFKIHLFKIVDLLKTCINSIKSTNGNVANSDQQEAVRSSQFLDELNALISSANSITTSLDNIQHGYRKQTPISNGTKSKPQVKEELNIPATETGDVDMEYSDSNNNNTDPKRADKRTSGQSSKPAKKANSNCDFKDVILCNLIDDFLLKENEF